MKVQGQVTRINAAGGVERVQMDLSIEEATSQIIEERAHKRPSWTKSRIVESLARVMQDLVQSDEKASDIGRSKKGNMRLEIRVPNGDIQPAKNGLDGVAEILLEDEDADDYVIRLRNGETIKPSEIAIKKRIRVGRYANTVVTDDVLVEMREFMNELKASGQLEV